MNPFEDVVDNSVIEILDKETLEQLLKMFDKAGY